MSNNDSGVAKWLSKNILNNKIKNIVKQGSSSTIEINYKSRVVYKKVMLNNEGINNGYKKLFYEMKHMMEYNKAHKKMFPDVYELKENNNHLIASMEYLYDGITLSDIIKDEKIKYNYLKSSIKYIIDKLFKEFYISKSDVTPNKNYIFDNYIDRITKRLKLTEEMIVNNNNYQVLDSIIKNGVTLNGEYYYPYSKYLDILKNDLNFLKKISISTNTESHHDLIPTNIIIDYVSGEKSIKDFKLIDPRGELDTGSANRHFMYDMGKFLFGLNGFDLIRMKIDENKKDIYTFKILGINNDIYKIDFNFNECNQIVKRYNFVYNKIFELFHVNRYNYFNSIDIIKNYELMFKFAETCNFIADIPCRINNNNNEEIAICFYLRGLSLMRDFIKLVYGNNNLEGGI